MYLIALCDDDEADLNKTEKMLGRYEERHVEVKFMTERFENAEQLLGMVREKGYVPDLIAAAATNGKEGFVRQEDFMVMPGTVVEIGKSYMIPVYDLEGNVIGEFEMS